MTESPGFVWLRDLLADPDRLKLPDARVPFIAWPGRCSMLSGAEKCGKSEAVSQGVAAASRGRDFLGEPCTTTTTLWLCLDEPENDLCRRLAALEADPDRVAIRTTRPENPAHLADLVRATGAGIVILDSLMSFMSGLVTTGGDAAQWTPHLKGLTSIARTTDAAMVWIHHANKATGNYRDSSAIGAEADMILEFQPHQHGDTGRKVRVKGRLPLRDFELDFVSGRYVLAGGRPEAEAVAHLPEHARVLLQLLSDAEPEGFASGAWQKAAGMAKTTFNRARRSLIRAGHAIGPEHTKTARYRITDAGEIALEVPGTTGANEVPRHLGTTRSDGATGAKPYVIGLAPGIRPGTSPESDYENVERAAIEDAAA